MEKSLLMLCCRLGQEVRPVSPAEYRQLSAAVRAALAKTQISEDIEITASVLSALGLPCAMQERVVRLLEREELLAQYLAASPDVTALTRISDGFPQRLRRLGHHCPPVLFCKGDLSLLESRCIALVGSRQLHYRGRTFARRIGALAAKEGLTLVSGDALGADTEAQEACLAAGGRVVAFVPDELHRHPMRKNVLYCSDEGYEFAFSAARALRRNRYIHALGEKVFVAQCPQCSGGTWAGTTENLQSGYSEVYVRKDDSKGVQELIARGAVPVTSFLSSVNSVRPAQLSIFD